MTSSSAPDLAPFYPPYLAAFNAHSWSDIATYLSPTCHGTYRGKLLKTSAEEMRPEYEKDFARCDRHEIAVKEMSQIRREETKGEEEWKKGIEHGLRLVLYDPTLKRTVIVHYWYRFENGKWLQCWHEILDQMTDEAV